MTGARGRIAVAVLAASAVCAAGAAAALHAPSDALSTEARSPRAVSYNFEAKFVLSFSVAWEVSTGSREGKCPSWTHTKENLEVVARSVVVRGNAYAIRGHFVIYPFPDLRKTRQAGTRNWAVSTGALGKAEAEINPRRVHEGRICVNGVSKPWIPSHDCKKLEYEQPFSGLSPVVRTGLSTLDQITNFRRGRELHRAIQIDVAPPSPAKAYKRCGYPPLLSPYPVSMAIRVTGSDIGKLRALKPRQTHRIETRDLAPLADLQCGPEIIADSCTFELDAFVEIRRQ